MIDSCLYLMWKWFT